MSDTDAMVEDITGAPVPDGVVVDPDAPPPAAAHGAWRTDVLGQVLGGVAGAFQAGVDLEQAFSRAFAEVSWGPLPAMRIGDMTLGMPHPHVPVLPFPPFGPVFRFLPLPQPGFVLDMGILSGASTVFINKQKAARCGDMGLCVPLCLGFMPLFEVFFGSAKVWAECQRAARPLDPTTHCNLIDQPVGLLKLGMSVGGGSGNVVVGGLPLPSLFDMAAGKLVEGVVGGLKRVARRARRVNWSRVIRPWGSLPAMPKWLRAPRPRRILVTYFAPFSIFGSGNASMDIARRLEQIWKSTPERFKLPVGVELDFIEEPIEATHDAARQFARDLAENGFKRGDQMVKLDPGNAVVMLGEVGSPLARVRIEDIGNWALPLIGGGACQTLSEAIANAGMDWTAVFLHVPGIGGHAARSERTLETVIEYISQLANSAT
jgi:hypothetical protein